jgi:hypothetical protein
MRVWERFAAVMSENLVKTSTTQSRITWLVSTDFWRVYVEKTKLGNFVFLYESLGFWRWYTNRQSCQFGFEQMTTSRHDRANVSYDISSEYAMVLLK